MALTSFTHSRFFAQLLTPMGTLRSTLGISLKTQEIYLIVFVARYLDLFTNHLSVYLTFMKIVFLCSTAYIIYLIRYQYNKSYSKQEDTFPRPLLLLVAPSAVLSLLLTANYHITEVRPLVLSPHVSPFFPHSSYLL